MLNGAGIEPEGKHELVCGPSTATKDTLWVDGILISW